MKKFKYYQRKCYKIVTKEDVIFALINILFAFCIYACERSFDKPTEFHRTGLLVWKFDTVLASKFPSLEIFVR